MRKRVAVLVQPSRAYGRDVLTGIVNHVSSDRSWTVFHDERHYSSGVPAWLHEWQGHGVITSVESDSAARFFEERGLPTVDLHGRFGVGTFSSVVADHARAAEIAFDHLTALGLTEIGFAGLDGVEYSRVREGAVRRRCKANHVGLHVLNSPYHHDTLLSGFEADASLDQGATTEWLASLPKPAGLIACNDIRGIQLLNAAREAGVSVPEDLAVIGFDNDTLICELATPPLSSVDLDAVRIGYAAASKLAELMRSDATSPTAEKSPPGAVITRQSTNLMAIADPEIAEVIGYIERNINKPIHIDDIVDEIAISRSTLERRFTRAVGRSLKQHITRVRISQIKQRLTQTDDKLDTIARGLGFTHTEYMNVLFKKQVGVTPGVYRREHRRRREA